MALTPSKTLTERLKQLTPQWVKLIDWRNEWLEKAHPYQLTPRHQLWDIWLLMAGRGTGKTLCAANELGWLALTDPSSRNLVTAPTSSDVRDTCFEGDSGLLNVLPKIFIKDYNKSFNELVLFNQAIIKGIPGGEPERFRGPQFHRGWADEVAAFQYPQTAWDLMSLGIRLGKRTIMLVTTTPKPIPLLRDLIRQEGKRVVVSRATTYQNLGNLATNFRDQVLRFEGTEMGRQEVYGELLDLSEAGILKKKWFKLYPARTFDDAGREIENPLPYFEKIVISLDTAMTEDTHSDRTACTIWGVFKHRASDGRTSTNALLLDCWADRLTYPDLRDRAKEAWNTRYGVAGGRGQLPTTFLIEDKGSGISLRQDLQSEMIPVEKFNPGRRDKVERANLASPILKDGFIWLPESDKRPGEMRNWIDPMMDELVVFPTSDCHDDYVDSCVQAWHYLYSAGDLHAPLNAAQPQEPYEEDYHERGRRRLNPYAQ